MQASFIFGTMLPMLRAKLEAIESETMEIELPGIDLDVTGRVKLLDENGVDSKTIAVSVHTTGGKGTMCLWAV